MVLSSASLSCVVDDLECPVCLVVMRPPSSTILACDNAHLFCLRCLRRGLNACPVCREDFKDCPPKRNRLAERWARKILE